MSAIHRCTGLPLGTLLAMLLPAVVSGTARAQSADAAPKPGLPLAGSFGVQAGVGYFTEHGPFGTDSNIGTGLALGYSLGVRASFEILPWLALDIRGLALHNDGTPEVSYGSTSTIGGLGAVRFTLPTAPIRPYVLLGLGGFHMEAQSGGSTTAQTELLSDTVSAFEAGLGAVVPTGHGVEVGVEWLYSHVNGEMLSTNPNADGGDPSTLSFFVQYRIPVWSPRSVP
jgi:opacity protein-like surface antigen